MVFKNLFFFLAKKKEIFVREGECGGSKGTSGIYTIHAKLFNSVLSKRFSKISFIYQKKKRDFWKVEEGSGFCSGTHNNHAMYSTALCPQDLRHLFFFVYKKRKEIFGTAVMLFCFKYMRTLVCISICLFVRKNEFLVFFIQF